MNNMYDVQQLLKRFGTFIYTGNRESDLELMSLEVFELYKAKLISSEKFIKIKHVINKELTSYQRRTQK